jgi:hypothetical protein
MNEWNIFLKALNSALYCGFFRVEHTRVGNSQRRVEVLTAFLDNKAIRLAMTANIGTPRYGREKNSFMPVQEKA